MFNISDSDSRKEVELVLMIVSEDPRTVAQKIAMLDSVAGYRLSRRPPTVMHDVYFDTSDDRLRREGVNFRVRRLDSGYWLTMKRSLGAFASLRSERQELEVPWSQSSLSKILKELASRGIALHNPAFTGTSNPVEVVKSTGLVMTQDRETRREVCDVFPETGEQLPLAELAVDSVQYNLATGTVSFCEVEVEEKASESGDALEGIKQALQERFGAELRSWKYGKLMTGRVVERLLEAGELDGLVEGGYLKPGAFEKIDRAAP